MKRAWVITREGPQHSQEVIGIVSARIGARMMKKHIEWLDPLLHSSPSTHFEMAKYNRPARPNEAEFDRTNTGIPVQSTIRCGHNQYLVARLASEVVLLDTEGNQPILKWV